MASMFSLSIPVSFIMGAQRTDASKSLLRFGEPLSSKWGSDDGTPLQTYTHTRTRTRTLSVRFIYK